MCFEAALRAPASPLERPARSHRSLPPHRSASHARRFPRKPPSPQWRRTSLSKSACPQAVPSSRRSVFCCGFVATAGCVPARRIPGCKRQVPSGPAQRLFSCWVRKHHFRRIHASAMSGRRPEGAVPCVGARLWRLWWSPAAAAARRFTAEKILSRRLCPTRCDWSRTTQSRSVRIRSRPFVAPIFWFDWQVRSVILHRLRYGSMSKPFKLTVKAVILDQDKRCLLIRRSPANRQFRGLLGVARRQG